MSTAHDATASMLGYLFQCRVALADALRRLRLGDTFTVGIEALDDVSFDVVGSASELLQTKHHVARAANLSDTSPDLWSSLRVWVDGRSAGTIPTDSLLHLLTTASASPGSAMAYLRAGQARSPDKARERLDGAAQTSENETNQKAYAGYLALTVGERMELLTAVALIDRHPDILTLPDSMRADLGLTVERKHLDALITRLEGWWYQRIISHLARRTAGIVPILSEEIEAEVDRLRGQFRDDNLPIDDDVLTAEIDESAFSNHLFVEQLRLITIANVRILNAMRQYFRACEQRSRWIREGFLLVGELDRYDRRLTEEWALHFNAMSDELGGDAAEDAMRTAARRLYLWAEIEAALPIRSACSELFVPRGSLQFLSNRARVGWHPKFMERLRHMMEEGTP